MPAPDQDQHIKLLLQTFFPQFLEAFAPELYREINPRSVQFLDKELSRLHGSRREGRIVDLAARVQFRDGAGFVLVHIEHQARREPNVRARLLFYAVRLMERYGLH